MQRVLVLGADGLIGGRLVARLGERGVAVTCTSFLPQPHCSHLDLASGLADWQPPAVDVAYLCAAVTSLAGCATDPEGTAAINVVGTLAAAKALIQHGAFVVFLSSNLVFDGTRPFEAATTIQRPRTEYGRQKAAVERALLDPAEVPAERVAVVRFTKVLGDRWPLVGDWASRLAENQQIRPYRGMVVAPIALSRAVDGLLVVGTQRLAGISQLSARGDLRYAEIAQALADRLGRDLRLVQPGQPETPAEHLPAHTTLDSGRLDAVLGPAPSPWHAIELLFNRAVSGEQQYRLR